MIDILITAALSGCVGFGIGAIVFKPSLWRSFDEERNMDEGYVTPHGLTDPLDPHPEIHQYQLVKVVDGKHVPYNPPLLIPMSQSPILAANHKTRETQIFHTYEQVK